MSSRLAAGERDLGGRLQHWRESLSLLRTPSEFLLGRGLGRFPANYSQAVAGRGLPGRLLIIDNAEESYLRLFGPAPGRERFRRIRVAATRTAGQREIHADL
jgi:hypothetical protein